jgi:hypothetical protein
MQKDKKEITFDPSLNQKISMIDNKKCTLYSGKSTVFCANLGKQFSKPVLIELKNKGYDAVKDYPQNSYSSQFPTNLRGADKAGNMFAVWGGDSKVEVVVFNTTSNANGSPILGKWSSQQTNPDFDLCDLSVHMGMFFHVNTKSPPNISTQFFDLIDGSPVSKAPIMPAY